MGQTLQTLSERAELLALLPSPPTNKKQFLLRTRIVDGQGCSKAINKVFEDFSETGENPFENKSHKEYDVEFAVTAFNQQILKHTLTKNNSTETSETSTEPLSAGAAAQLLENEDVLANVLSFLPFSNLVHSIAISNKKMRNLVESSDFIWQEQYKTFFSLQSAAKIAQVLPELSSTGADKKWKTTFRKMYQMLVTPSTASICKKHQFDETKQTCIYFTFKCGAETEMNQATVERLKAAFNVIARHAFEEGEDGGEFVVDVVLTEEPALAAGEAEGQKKHKRAHLTMFIDQPVNLDVKRSTKFITPTNEHWNLLIAFLKQFSSKVAPLLSHVDGALTDKLPIVTNEILFTFNGDAVLAPLGIAVGSFLEFTEEPDNKQYFDTVKQVTPTLESCGLSNGNFTFHFDISPETADEGYPIWGLLEAIVNQMSTNEA